MDLPKWSTNNRVAVNLFTLLVLLAGIGVSSMYLKRDLFPDVTTNFVQITTLDPETSVPIDIERTITIPIEEELAEVQGIDKMRSTSQDNFSNIFLEVDPDITDVSPVVADVRQAVDRAQAELPASAERPVVEEFDIPFPLVTFVVSYPTDFDLPGIRTLLDKLDRDLKIIPGVSKVLIDGLEDREVWVEIDPFRLQDLGITYGEVAAAVARKNRNQVGGRLDAAGGQRVVRVLGEIQSAEELENLPIKQVGDRVVQLRDVATIKETTEEAQTLGRANLQRAVTFTVVKKKGEDALEIAAKAKATFAEFTERLPKDQGLETQVTGDATKYINIRIMTVLQNGFQALIMVTLLLVLMLNWRLALLVAVGIPVSFAGCFLVLWMGGYSINLLSLFAMIMALGMVVDDAVVVAENVYRYYERGYSPVQAARLGTNEVLWPVLGSVSTTVAAFLPLIWGEGIIGKFLAVVPIVVIATLIFSLLQAFLVLPSHLADFVKPARSTDEIEAAGPGKRAPFWTNLLVRILPLVAGLIIIGNYMPEAVVETASSTMAYIVGSVSGLFTNGETLEAMREFGEQLGTFLAYSAAFVAFGIALYLTSSALWGPANRFFAYLAFQTELTYSAMRDSIDHVLKLIIEVYVHLLVICLRWRYWVICAFLSCLVLVGVGIELGIVRFKLFDVDFADFITVKVELPSDYSLEQTEEVMARIEEKIAERLPATDLVALVTRVGAKLDVTDQFLEYGSNTGMITVDIDEQSPDARKPTPIEADLREILNQFPEVIVGTAKKEEGGPPVGRAVNIELQGPDFAVLQEMAAVLENRLSAIDGVVNVGNDFPRGKTEFRVFLDEDRAAGAGIDVAAVGESLAAGFRGIEAAKLRWGNDEVTIRVKIDERFSQDPELLRGFRLTGRTGESIDLGSVADVVPIEGIARVKRIDNERVLTVSADVLPIVTSAEVNEQAKSWIPELLADHPGYHAALTGENEDTEKSLGAMVFAAAVALLLIYGLLATITNSFLQPLVIMAVIPFGIVGVFIGLIFMNEALGLMSIMGTIALAGIVVNNSVVFVDFINRYRHEHAKFDDAIEAANVRALPHEMGSFARWRSILVSGRTRFRPIFLTTCTTVVGLLSLAFQSSGQEQFLAPMAQAVVWGLSFATLITMILIPCLYAILDDIRSAFHIVTNAAEGTSVSPPPVAREPEEWEVAPK